MRRRRLGRTTRGQLATTMGLMRTDAMPMPWPSRLLAGDIPPQSWREVAKGETQLGQMRYSELKKGRCGRQEPFAPLAVPESPGPDVCIRCGVATVAIIMSRTNKHTVQYRAHAALLAIVVSKQMLP